MRFGQRPRPPGYQYFVDVLPDNGTVRCMQHHATGRLFHPSGHGLLEYMQSARKTLRNHFESAITDNLFSTCKIDSVLAEISNGASPPRGTTLNVLDVILIKYSVKRHL